MPVETSLDREHADLRERRAAIDGQIEALEGRRADERSVLRALYSGHEPLQEAVQDLFERMGAVFPPQVDVKKDDGFFDISIDGRSYRFVCEVKSKERAPLGKNAFQQLVEWWDNHSHTGKAPDKGVVIGNTEMALPLGERVDPFPAGGWMSDAEQRGFVVISSSEVFAAWEAGVQSGRGHEDFWRRLLKARGRFRS